MARSDVRCLHLVWGFDNGAKLLEAAEGTASRDRFKACEISLPLWTVARLGEDQDRGVASCEPGPVAAVREALMFAERLAEKATPSDAGSPGRGTHVAGTVWWRRPSARALLLWCYGSWLSPFGGKVHGRKR